MYDCSEGPVVRSGERGLPRTDVLGSKFEVGVLTPEQEVEKKSLPKRATKSALRAVLESCLLSLLHCRFLVRSVANFPSFRR